MAGHAIAPQAREWLTSAGLVDAGVDMAAVRLHAGGPVGRYLRLQHRGAITFGRHIFFADEARRGREDLLVHELVHVAQYQEMGVPHFLWRYLLDLTKARFRYSASLPLEAPAYARQREAEALLAGSGTPAGTGAA